MFRNDSICPSVCGAHLLWGIYCVYFSLQWDHQCLTLKLHRHRRLLSSFFFCERPLTRVFCNNISSFWRTLRFRFQNVLTKSFAKTWRRGNWPKYICYKWRDSLVQRKFETRIEWERKDLLEKSWIINRKEERYRSTKETVVVNNLWSWNK